MSLLAGINLGEQLQLLFHFKFRLYFSPMVKMCSKHFLFAKLCFIGVLLSSITGFAQSLNTYKYIIVPESYAFLKNEPNKYELNALTKFLFNKYGFQALLSTEEKPVDLQQNRCLGLTADILNESSLFTTKLQVVLNDCDAREVYQTQVGKSKIKEYKPAFHEALREAMKEFGSVQYAYRPAVPLKNSVYVDEKGIPRDLVGVNDGGLNSPLPPEQEIESEAAAPLKNSSLPTTDSNPGVLEYLWREEVYLLRPVAHGFVLLQSRDQKELGNVYKTKQQNTFVVKAGDLSGTGHFDSYGNFVLDRINPVNNQLISDIFARKN